MKLKKGTKQPRGRGRVENIKNRHLKLPNGKNPEKVIVMGRFGWEWMKLREAHSRGLSIARCGVCPQFAVTVDVQYPFSNRGNRCKDHH